MDFIDLKSQQALIKEEVSAAIARVLDHGQYILGPEVSELESKLCNFTGSEHCLGVSSGTDALLIALMALDIGPGDEVITVPYTWISTAEVILLVGAKPVFVDIDKDTWNMAPELLDQAITPDTKAIIPVGIYGQTADMAAINRVSENHGGIPVIEDAAQSFGATHHGKQSGNLATISTTSFFPSKPLGGYGDGGAIFTNDGQLAEKMRWIHVHGQSKKHHHPVLGINGRLDSIQAAVVLEKLKIFPREIALRQQIARRYTDRLAHLDTLTPQQLMDGNTSVYAQYTILCKDREQTQRKLNDKKVPNVPYYSVPLHRQPVFEQAKKHLDLSVTDIVAQQGLSLPMSPYLAGEDQDEVISALD